MEQIKIWVEEIISLTGLTGDAVAVVRHLLLVIVAILLSMAAGLLCRKIFVPLVMKLTARTEARWDDILFNERVLVSACHIVPAIVIWQLLPWVFYQFPTVRELLARATAIYIVVMSVRTVFVFIDAIKDLEGDRRTSTQQYIYSFLGVLRVLMIFVAVIIVVSILINRDPVKLFAGLGATSAILMLVFQDTIKGLVAGIRLTSNDMLHKGDWITVPKAGANGVVEDMSLTTVKIRNFDNTIVTVTPQTLVEDSFQNWQGMQESDGRRVCRSVYFDFRSICRISENQSSHICEQFPEFAKEVHSGDVNMTLFRRYMENYLVKSDLVNHDMTCMVRQNEPTQSGLPIEFYFFLNNKEWVTYEHQAAEFFEYVYATAPEFGLTIYQQFPKQS